MASCGNTKAPCWQPVMSHCVFLTSSIFSFLIGLSNAQGEVTPPTGSVANYSFVPCHTTECEPCSHSDSDSSVGAIIGSAIVGAVVGASVTATIMCYLKKRSHSPPPKDYVESGDQVHFDVNRNNDEAVLTNGGDRDIEEESGTKSTRVHKKLERLVQKGVSDKPADLEIEMSAVPLIHNTDSSSNVTSAHASRGSQDAKDNFSRYTSDPTASPDAAPADYLNWGDQSPVEQPYDQLAIVPEEVEYENVKMNDYQPIIVGTDTISTA